MDRLIVSEANKTYTDYLEMTSEEGLEARLANASINPKIAQFNIGTRNGGHLILALALALR